MIKIGDKVKTVKTGDYRLENRIGVVENIINMPAKYEKSALIKYHIRFLDKGLISEGEFVRGELKKLDEVVE
jgi:hypothetical protein